MLIFKLKFDFADDISTGEGKDYIVIQIKDDQETSNNLFTSDDGTKTLDPASFVVLKEI